MKKGKSVNHIVHHSDLSTGQICSIFIENCGKETLRIEKKNYTIPAPTPTNMIEQREREYPSRDKSGLTMLQIADLHLDRKYSPGSANTCSEPLCCRKEFGFPQAKDEKAGKWGDYNCDCPDSLLDLLIAEIRQKEKLDYIIWTGDNVAHDGWKVSGNEVLEVNAEITEKLRTSLPDTKLIPVIGNHDSSPLNSFPPPQVEQLGFGSKWLYNGLADIWKSMLPESALRTFRHGGYYSLQLYPDFRIIVLNTNVAYRFNLWVILTAKEDPFGQLAWLASELSSVKSQGQKCHIIGHVSPTDPDLLDSWSLEYAAIVRGYADTVKAQFFSHTHMDEAQLYLNDRHVPFLMSYLSPSLTPWTDVNPGFKEYTIDGSGSSPTWEVIESKRWAIDVAKARVTSEMTPKWKLMYAASYEYGLTSLSPASWMKMIENMKSSENIFMKYYRNLSGKRPLKNEACDGECRRELLSSMTTQGGTAGREKLFGFYIRQHRTST